MPTAVEPRLIPLILNWPQSPAPVTSDLQRVAGAAAWDIKLLLDRQTGRSMRFKRMADNRTIPAFISSSESARNTPDIFAEVVQMEIPFPRDQQDEPLWERNGKVNETDDDWWNISRHLREVHGYDHERDIYVCWINGYPGDHSGIASPYGLLWNEERNPNVGGVALNGRGQLETYMANKGRGWEAARSVLYAAHETGHALGEHHSGYIKGLYPKGRPYDIGYYDTLMGYGYNILVAGKPELRTMEYRAGLLLPDQQLRLRAHSAFIDNPPEVTAFDAGIVDSIVLRKDGLKKIFEEIAAGTLVGDDIIARLNVGPLQAERK